MNQIVGVVTVLIVALFAPVAEGVTIYNTGRGRVYKLGVTQDVTLERSYRNFNYLQYLLVSKHPRYPNKRSLVQFENLPRSCPYSKIQKAKMYLYFVYAHKASFHSIYLTPWIPRYMKVRQCVFCIIISALGSTYNKMMIVEVNAELLSNKVQQRGQN